MLWDLVPGFTGTSALLKRKAEASWDSGSLDTLDVIDGDALAVSCRNDSFQSAITTDTSGLKRSRLINSFVKVSHSLNNSKTVSPFASSFDSNVSDYLDYGNSMEGPIAIERLSSATSSVCESSGMCDHSFPFTPETSPSLTSGAEIHDPNLNLIADAFIRAASGPLVSHALCMKSYTCTHPVGAGEYSSVEVTLCAMFALCLRARLSPFEITPEILLTSLWVNDSWCSQYAGELSCCLHQYLFHLSNKNELKVALTRVMPKLQLELLKRCNWRALLLEDKDLRPAGAILSDFEGFWQLCSTITARSERMTAEHWARKAADTKPYYS